MYHLAGVDTRCPALGGTHVSTVVLEIIATAGSQINHLYI